MSKVSIIVPNYNHSQFLEKRLNSIFNQTYQDFEVILLDDYSTDNSVEILKKYADHPKVSHLIINEENSGSPFKQWRKGITLAEGKYIWIAESDDWADLTFLETLVPSLDNGCSLSYCRSVQVKEETIVDNNYFWADGLDSNRWKNNFVNQGLGEIKKYLVYRNTIPNASACVFRRSSVASFPEEITNMKFCGDWLFWVILLRQNKFKVAYFSLKLNYHRTHQETSRKVKQNSLERKRFQERFYTIRKARQLSGKTILLPTEYINYDWLFNQLLSRLCLEKHQKLFPPIPIEFYPAYYSFFIKIKLRLKYN